MKTRFLFLLPFALLISMNVNSQSNPKQEFYDQLECILFVAPTSGYNDEEITAQVTIKNTSQTDGIWCYFYLSFWEGIPWFMYPTYVPRLYSPGMTWTLTLRGRIPSADYIWMKGPLYELRVHMQPYGGTNYEEYRLKNGSSPFTLK